MPKSFTAPDTSDAASQRSVAVARAGDALASGSEAAALAEIFKILGDVTRVRIIDALSRAELCVSDLAALLELSESAVSHQLRLLRNLRLVRPRRAGRLVFYALDDRHILDLFGQALRHVQEESAVQPRRGDRGPDAD